MRGFYLVRERRTRDDGSETTNAAPAALHGQAARGKGCDTGPWSRVGRVTASEWRRLRRGAVMPRTRSKKIGRDARVRRARDAREFAPAARRENPERVRGGTTRVVCFLREFKVGVRERSCVKYVSCVCVCVRVRDAEYACTRGGRRRDDGHGPSGENSTARSSDTAAALPRRRRRRSRGGGGAARDRLHVHARARARGRGAPGTDVDQSGRAHSSPSPPLRANLRRSLD